MKLCPACRDSIAALSEKDHVGDADSERAAHSIAKQCPRCIALNLGCSECDVVGRRGYCAPLRCYCGHPACHAFASYTALKRPTDFNALTQKSTSAWDERAEGSSWIDKL